MKMFEKFRDINTWNVQLRETMENIYRTTCFPKLWSRCVDTFSTIYKGRKGDVCKEELSKIKCPTLIIHGAKDPLLPLSHSEYLHKNIAGSQLVIMPEGKHHLHMQLASEFNCRAIFGPMKLFSSYNVNCKFCNPTLQRL